MADNKVCGRFVTAGRGNSYDSCT